MDFAVFYRLLCVAAASIVIVLGCCTALSIMTLQELNIQIVEQLDRLQLAVEIAHVLKWNSFNGSERHTKGYDFDEPSTCFSFAHYKQISFFSTRPIWDRRAGKLEDTTESEFEGHGNRGAARERVHTRRLPEPIGQTLLGQSRLDAVC